MRLLLTQNPLHLVFFLCLRITLNVLELGVLFFSFSFLSVLLDVPADVFYQYLMDCCCRRVWPVSLDTLESTYVKNAKVNMKFCAWHAMCFTEHNNGGSNRTYTYSSIGNLLSPINISYWLILMFTILYYKLDPVTHGVTCSKL